MEKINIAELLKDCPKGMELDCTIVNGLYFDEVTFDEVTENNLIKCYTKFTSTYNTIYFYSDGSYLNHTASKCVIFPKGKTTWEGFVPPCKFKDGDVISDALATCIFKREGRIKGTVDYYCGIHDDDFCVKDNKRNQDGHYGCIVDYRLATEEEKQKLFDAIKANGYKWNEETKTLEKLIEPKFKVGDRVLYKTYGIYTTIKTIKWNAEKEQFFYSLDPKNFFVATADELKPCKEETMEERKYSELRMPLDDDDKLATEATIDGDKITPPENYLIGKITKMDNGMLVEFVKKQQYPKTYVECAKILDCFGAAHIDGYKGELLDKLQELLICRDAYWKIVGDWKPDWKKADERKYCIVNTEGNITNWVQKTTNKILAFPTEEMCDAFYENFKELIETCKELL